MAALRHRAPVFLRVNTARLTRDEAQARLALDDIATVPHDLAETALQVVANERKIAGSSAYIGGLVELQDAASQAVVAALPLEPGRRVLDYCAGGGGKALAMAARAPLRLFAHDADPRRMRDLPGRAERARVSISLLDSERLEREGPFDLVLADVPCSGSGSWRRAPEAKWLLTQDRLDHLCSVQAAILDRVAATVSDRGKLAYATCSLLDAENRCQTEAFLRRNPGWTRNSEQIWTPLHGGDGFYLAVLART
jgi:16S rRNA (cytosine967-C5)-methyltransferase